MLHFIISILVLLLFFLLFLFWLLVNQPDTYLNTHTTFHIGNEPRRKLLYTKIIGLRKYIMFNNVFLFSNKKLSLNYVNNLWFIRANKNYCYGSLNKSFPCKRCCWKCMGWYLQLCLWCAINCFSFFLLASINCFQKKWAYNSCLDMEILLHP